MQMPAKGSEQIFAASGLTPTLGKLTLGKAGRHATGDKGSQRENRSRRRGTTIRPRPSGQSFAIGLPCHFVSRCGGRLLALALCLRSFCFQHTSTASRHHGLVFTTGKDGLCCLYLDEHRIRMCGGEEYAGTAIPTRCPGSVLELQILDATIGLEVAMFSTTRPLTISSTGTLVRLANVAPARRASTPFDRACPIGECLSRGCSASRAACCGRGIG